MFLAPIRELVVLLIHALPTCHRRNVSRVLLLDLESAALIPRTPLHVPPRSVASHATVYPAAFVRIVRAEFFLARDSAPVVVIRLLQSLNICATSVLLLLARKALRQLGLLMLAVPLSQQLKCPPSPPHTIFQSTHVLISRSVVNPRSRYLLAARTDMPKRNVSGTVARA